MTLDESYASLPLLDETLTPPLMLKMLLLSSQKSFDELRGGLRMPLRRLEDLVFCTSHRQGAAVKCILDGVGLLRNGVFEDDYGLRSYKTSPAGGLLSRP